MSADWRQQEEIEMQQWYEKKAEFDELARLDRKFQAKFDEIFGEIYEQLPRNERNQCQSDDREEERIKLPIVGFGS
jgi:hypothetical protein